MKSATLGVVAILATLTVGDAFAQSASPPPPDPGVGQIDQYIEVIPTAGGGVPTSVLTKAKETRSQPDLTAKARQEVETSGGEDTDVLTEIASMSSPASATPTKPRSPGQRSTKSVAGPSLTADQMELLEGVRLAVSATSGRARLVAISLLLVALTFGLTLASRRRMRASSRP